MKFAVTFTPEQLQDNWNQFIQVIEDYIPSPRREKLISLYNEMQEHMIMAPAAINNNNHNCFPGGYVDHIIRVVHGCIQLNKIWLSIGAHKNFTDEEMVFAALNHDLGKLGTPEVHGCDINDNDWEVQKLSKFYKYNTELPFFTVPDRTLFILQSKGIEVSQNEFLAIKLHDGLYEEGNKAYLIGYQLESRLRTYLPLVLHQADLMAARVEWERQWPAIVTNNKVNKPQFENKKPSQARTGALKSIKATPAMMDLLKNL
jgi:hypothetical protein